MKITKNHLKQIIKEELSAVLEREYGSEQQAGRAEHIDGIKKKLYGVHLDGTPGEQRNWADTRDGKPDGKKTLYWLDDNAPQWDRDMDNDVIQARGKYQEQLEWNISTLEGQLKDFKEAEGGSVDWLHRGERVD